MAVHGKGVSDGGSRGVKCELNDVTGQRGLNKIGSIGKGKGSGKVTLTWDLECGVCDDSVDGCACKGLTEAGGQQCGGGGGGGDHDGRQQLMVSVLHNRCHLVGGCQTTTKGVPKSEEFRRPLLFLVA